MSEGRLAAPSGSRREAAHEWAYLQAVCDLGVIERLGPFASSQPSVIRMASQCARARSGEMGIIRFGGHAFEAISVAMENAKKLKRRLRCPGPEALVSGSACVADTLSDGDGALP